jgi:GT2 family glycosyltransferase
MTVSVLICTYKRKELLKKCLKALFEGSQEVPDQVVIVDGEEGKAEDVVSGWRERSFNIILCPVRNINLAVARNVGLSFCTGDIIALTDDDVEVGPGWVKQIKELHANHPEAGAIGGRVIAKGNRLVDKIADLVIFPVPKNHSYVRTVAGANASYKKEVMKNVGDFDITLFRGEDVDYNWRILKRGHEIFFCRELVVYHNHRSSLAGLLKQLYMYGRAYYLVRKKWPQMYCVYPRQIRRFKDILKMGYFFIAFLIEPLKILPVNTNFYYKIRMYMPLVLCQLAWRLGMIYEFFLCKSRGKNLWIGYF